MSYHSAESWYEMIITTVNSNHVLAHAVCKLFRSAQPVWTAGFTELQPQTVCEVSCSNSFMQKRTVQIQIKLKWRNILKKAHPESSLLLSPPHLQSVSQLLQASPSPLPDSTLGEMHSYNELWPQEHWTMFCTGTYLLAIAAGNFIPEMKQIFKKIK